MRKLHEETIDDFIDDDDDSGEMVVDVPRGWWRGPDTQTSSSSQYQQQHRPSWQEEIQQNISRQVERSRQIEAEMGMKGQIQQPPSIMTTTTTAATTTSSSSTATTSSSMAVRMEDMSIREQLMYQNEVNKQRIQQQQQQVM